MKNKTRNFGLLNGENVMSIFQTVFLQQFFKVCIGNTTTVSFLAKIAGTGTGSSITYTGFKVLII
jgi:hypothetical protein